MRVVHLSTDNAKGGGSRAAARVHSGLRVLGVDSHMFVLNQSKKDANVIVYQQPYPIIDSFSKFFRRREIAKSFKAYKQTRPKGLEPFSDDRTLFRDKIITQLPDCDIINLHWVAGFLDYQSFFQSIPKKVKVVWRLSDLNPITGGCHYDLGCENYQNQCGTCPQLGSTVEHDYAYEIWKRKEQIYNGLDPKRLHFVAQSRWIKKEIEQSPLVGKFGVTLIPNSVRSDIFKPRKTDALRQELGISDDSKILLFVANSITNTRKGMRYLIVALESLQDTDNIVLVSVGHGKPNFKTNTRHIHLGFLDDDVELSHIYSMADIYVIPSLQDNLPNTILESLACGTPVIGFQVGGIPDIVQPNKTGQLVPEKDSKALAQIIRKFLADEKGLSTMSVNCRKVVLKKFTPELQADKFRNLYEHLLSR